MTSKENLFTFTDQYQKIALNQIISKIQPKIVMEIGVFYGGLTHWILSNFNVNMICIDPWDPVLIISQNEMKTRTYQFEKMFFEYPLYETFLKNIKEYQDRVTPIKSTSISGMIQSLDKGLIPDLIFIDGHHKYTLVKDEINFVKKFFPKCFICGDDYNWEEVKEAVDECCPSDCTVEVEFGRTWYYQQKNVTIF